jgi:hypothetical protein
MVNREALMMTDETDTASIDIAPDTPNDSPDSGEARAAVMEAEALATIQWCAACGGDRQRRLGGTSAWMLCSDCETVVCWECGAKTPDVMRRSVHGFAHPALCTACCATHPGRAWMKQE